MDRIAMLSENEINEFKGLFSKYCRSEINNGHCEEGDCEFCAVNTAYDRIFSTTELDDEEYEGDDE